MLTKDDIIAILKKNKRHFSNQGVVQIGLFGSYAKNIQDADSDIDVLIELTHPDWNLFCTIWNTLEQQLQKKVDLVRKGPHLRKNFLQSVEQEVIYA